jgi:tetratricopeptide (TPR) repeat protein
MVVSTHEISASAMDREQRRGSESAGALPSFGGGAEATSAGTVASLFAAAVAQHQAGALADAERQYRQILALFPDHADSLHNLGLIALQHGNAAAAVDLIARAIAANGRVAEYHYNIALAFRSLNRVDDVAGHLQQAIEIRPNYALAHLNLGNVHREQGRLSDAVACYERAVALSPNAAVAYFNLGNIKSEQGRWDEAAASYRQALRLDPNHAEAYAKLGAALLARGAAGEAIAHLEQALALDASLLGTYQDLGKAFLAAGDLESAIDTATRALAVSETAQNKAFFAQCIRSAQFAAVTPWVGSVSLTWSVAMIGCSSKLTSATLRICVPVGRPATGMTVYEK